MQAAGRRQRLSALRLRGAAYTIIAPPFQPQAMPQSTCNTTTGNKPMGELIFNLALPAVILYALSDALGARWALVLALSMPLGYGIRHYLLQRQINGLSLLGIISVLLTGGIGLLQLDPKYIAIKEAAVPAIIGLAFIVPLGRQPLVHLLLYNSNLLDTVRIESAMARRGTALLLRPLLRRVSWILAGSLFMSAALNWALATFMLSADPGTVLYNQQLGKMLVYSYAVIALPCTAVCAGALWYMFRALHRLTGLPAARLLRGVGR